MFVRTATADDALAVRRILDAAMLDPGDVEARIADGDVLVAGDRVATADGEPPASGPSAEAGERERLLGAVVLEAREHGAYVAAIGVRRRHRDRGIGTALIEHALDREGALTARFDANVRPFYEALGFSIDPVGDRRLRGYRSGSVSFD